MKKIYLTTVAFLVLVFSSTNLYSQLLPDDDLRDENLGCNSNNYTVTEVFLSGSSTDSTVPVPSCNAGEQVTAYVWANYTSNSNSTVYAFTIFADLILNHQDESSDTIFYQHCVGDLPSANGGVINNVMIDTINWTCGDEIIFSNATLGWVTNSTTCAVVDLEDFNKAQCDNVGDILVDAPLIANYIYDVNCSAEFSIDFTSTTTGGLIRNPNDPIDVLIPNPYQYTWDWGHNGVGTGPVEGPSSFLPSDAIFNHQFPNAGDYEVTLTVTDGDAPVNSSTVVHTVTVILPVSGNAIVTTPITCTGSTATVTITGSDGLAPYNYSFNSENNSTGIFINVSAGNNQPYTITDANGCVYNGLIDVLNGDTTPPTASNPAAINIQCIGDIPDPDINIIIGEEDNSGNIPIVAWVSDSSDGLSCPETITRTYSVTDACDNQILVTQSIIINDDTNPTASNPAAIPVQCIGDVPAQDISVVTDASDNCPIAPVVAWVSDSSDGLSCPETITRTYSVTDACDNQILVTQSIIINDTIAPDITSCNLNPNTTSTCSDTSANEAIADQWNLDNIAALEACATDNCDIDLMINSNYNFANLNQVCGPCGTLSVVYDVLDDCGNNSPITLNLSFNDNTPPDLTTCTVASESLECSGTDNQAIADQWNLDNIAALEACATDDTNITVTSDYLYINLSSTCGQGGTIPVTYTVTDECGGVATRNVVLTLEDTTPPDLSGSVQ